MTAMIHGGGELKWSRKKRSVLTLLSVPVNDAPQPPHHQCTVGQLAEGQRHDGGALEVSTSNNTVVSPSA